jgi:hypothetical protein
VPTCAGQRRELCRRAPGWSRSACRPAGLADVRPTPRRARSVAALVKIGRHSGNVADVPTCRACRRAGQDRLAAPPGKIGCRASGLPPGNVGLPAVTRGALPTLFYSARFRRYVGAPGFRPVAEVRRQDRLPAVTIRHTFTTSAKVSAVFGVAKQTVALKQCNL